MILRLDRLLADNVVSKSNDYFLVSDALNLGPLKAIVLDLEWLVGLLDDATFTGNWNVESNKCVI
jgi:hypothetical protein